eukprot:2544054-Prymnesium_polylepis.3
MGTRSAPWGGDGGGGGGMHDVAAAARFQGGLGSRGQRVRGTEGRVHLERSHHVSFRIFNQNGKRSKW